MVGWRRRRDRGDGDVSASEWMHRGADVLGTDLTRAEVCYRRAIELDPSLREAWFDLGLVHKWRQEWAPCLRCNQQAAALLDRPQSEPDAAYWNAGIAATALEDWVAARWAWKGYGIPIDDGEGEIRQDFGLGVVRLPVGETVWGRRIDPARMIVQSVPLPDSGFRCGDVVLHDGEPQGSRVVEERAYTVFNAISRWRQSLVPTVQVIGEADASKVEGLIESIVEAGMEAENWTLSIVIHCLACSHGRVDYDHPDHDHAPPASGSETRIGCSGDQGQITDLVTRWAETSDATLVAIEEVG